MTRINTNVSSLTAQNTLARANNELQTSLSRLSTGLRINRGKDDPAGLIASEALRSDIISTEKAISNSERANQLIATADSALGQVSNLLNDIRGLVTEAANTGALSDDQVAANQLQLDSSLEAIDRIAQVTSFQGKRLLDGNLDFITSGADNSKIQGLQVDQANFGTQSSINAQVNVVKQATQGQLNFSFGAVASDVVLEVGGANGSEAFNFAAGSSIEEVASAINLVSDSTGVEAVVEKAATAGSAVVSSFGENNDIQLTATEEGFDAGNVRVKYTEGGTSGTTATYTAASGTDPATIDVALQTEAAEAATGTVNDPNATNNALNVSANIPGSDFNGTNVQLVDDSLRSFSAVTQGSETFEYSADAKEASAIVDFADANSDLVVTANKAGTRNNEVAITFADAGAGQPVSAAYDEDAGTLIISADFADGAVDVQDIKDAVATVTDSDGDLAFTATDGNGSDGSGTIDFTQAGTQSLTGNTGFTGGEAGTLYAYIEEGVSTAEDVRASLGTQTDVETLRAAELFSVSNTVDSDGSGVLVAQAFDGAVDGGVTGGAVIATANDVVAAINGAQSQVEASNAEGNNGFGKVSTFQDFAFSGSVESNNRLQFLAPGSSPNVQFAAGGANQSLGLDTTTSPREEDFSSLTVQNDDADGSFSISARLKGTEYDGYTVSVVDNADVTGGTSEFVVLDKDAKTIEINIEDGVSTTDDIVNAINNDDYTNEVFSASTLGLNGTDAVTIADLDLTSDSKTSGGLTDPGELVINLATDAEGNVTTTANDLIAFFDDPSSSISNSSEAAAALSELTNRGISVTNVSGSNGTGVLQATTSDIEFGTNGTELEDVQAAATTNAVNGENAQLSFTAVNAGEEYGGVNVEFAVGGFVNQGEESGSYDANSKTLTFTIASDSTAADIENLFDSSHANYDADLAAQFTASAEGTGAGVVTINDSATLSSGVNDIGTTDGAALLGNSDLADQGLTFRSSNYGSDEFVSVKALQGSFDLSNENGVAATRSNGTDVNVRINGIQAIGNGLKASINTSSLDVSFSLSADTKDGESLGFNITGGGAQFQLGPDVVSNQQARLGIQSVSTATLGGVNGRLFELRSGGAKSLSADVGGAAKVIDEVVSVVTSLRGRLGAFQKTTLDSNISSLNDTLANLTEAESSIRDADFAKESANLTRAQILVQSGTSVLGIANSNPQNALSLLR